MPVRRWVQRRRRVGNTHTLDVATPHPASRTRRRRNRRLPPTASRHLNTPHAHANPPRECAPARTHDGIRPACCSPADRSPVTSSAGSACGRGRAAGHTVAFATGEPKIGPARRGSKPSTPGPTRGSGTSGRPGFPASISWSATPNGTSSSPRSLPTSSLYLAPTTSIRSSTRGNPTSSSTKSPNSPGPRTWASPTTLSTEVGLAHRNDATIYAFVNIDVARGPVVIQIPPGAIVGLLDDFLGVAHVEGPNGETDGITDPHRFSPILTVVRSCRG